MTKKRRKLKTLTFANVHGPLYRVYSVSYQLPFNKLFTEDDTDEFSSVHVLDLWPDKRSVIDEVYKKTHLETELTLEFFDMPYLFNPNPECGEYSNDFI